MQDIQTESAPVMYACDPEKNRECRKRTCMYNQDAEHPVCDRTSHVEYAKLDEDGEPIEA